MSWDKNPAYPPAPKAGYSPPGLPGAPQAVTAPRPEEIPTIEHLQQLSKLFVRQRLDWTEILVNYDVSNTYEIFLSPEHKAANQRWLFAKEQSEICQRACFPKCREFQLDIGISRPRESRDVEEHLGLTESAFVYPMIRLHRPFYCCLSEVEATDGKGASIGHAKEACTNILGCLPIKIDIFKPGKSPDSSDPDYQIQGTCPCWIGCVEKCPCREPIDFEMVELASNRKVGVISNVPNGWCKMCFSNADDYEVTFEPGATPTERGMLLGMTIITDFKWFEAKQQQNQRGIGRPMM